MALYATGVRRAELTHLKISDVDSQRMVVHIQGGKGRKDRLCAMAHKRSYVPGKVMCRELRSISKRHRLLRIAFMSRCVDDSA